MKSFSFKVRGSVRKKPSKSPLPRQSLFFHQSLTCSLLDPKTSPATQTPPPHRWLFHLFASTLRKEDRAGEVVEDWEEEILPVTDMETILPQTGQEARLEDVAALRDFQFQSCTAVSKSLFHSGDPGLNSRVDSDDYSNYTFFKKQIDGKITQSWKLPSQTKKHNNIILILGRSWSLRFPPWAFTS